MLTLLEAVRHMRRAQKAFYASRKGTQEHATAYSESRKYEKIVDRMIEENEEPDLFEEIGKEDNG